MNLIADGGSTKTSWSIFKDGNLASTLETVGFNPFYVNENYIIDTVLTDFGCNFDFQQVESIHFYGAGCEGDKNYVLENALSTVFSVAELEVQSDLIGAGKALIGDGTALVSILGTGMNSCVMSNGQVLQQIDSLGFHLGDEGSGGYMGKSLLKQYARRNLSEEIAEKFNAQYKLLPTQILKSFYDHPLQNKYAASFTTFLFDNLDDDQMMGIVKGGFIDLFENVIRRYKDHESYELNCVGSIAYVFQDILKDVAAERNISIGKIIKSPMEGLSSYHFPNKI